MDIYGTVVNPIQNTSGGDSDYSGNNLEPEADLSNADLEWAALFYANLTYANLSNASLSNSYLEGADLSNANLIDADLSNAELWDANLSEADLSGVVLFNATGIGHTNGSAPFYDANTDFTNAWTGSIGEIPFDPVAAGWTLVPEPSTALLLGLGLTALAVRRGE